MLYKHDNDIIEADSREEAARILGTDDLRSFRKPSEKAFLLWCWFRCDRKDGRLIKLTQSAEPADFILEYRDDPNIVRRQLREWGVKVSEWAKFGEPRYDYERHTELFHKL